MAEGSARPRSRRARRAITAAAVIALTSAALLALRARAFERNAAEFHERYQ